MQPNYDKLQIKHHNLTDNAPHLKNLNKKNLKYSRKKTITKLKFWDLLAQGHRATKNYCTYKKFANRQV